MGKGGYYLVTGDGAPAVEEVPGGGKAAIVCERPGLAEGDEAPEPVTFEDLAFLLEARADIGYVRVRGPEGSRTVETARFLEGASSWPRLAPQPTPTACRRAAKKGRGVTARAVPRVQRCREANPQRRRQRWRRPRAR